MKTAIRHGQTVLVAADGTSSRPTPASRWRGVRGFVARECGCALGNDPGAGDFKDGSGDYVVIRSTVKAPDASRRLFDVAEVLATIRDHARAIS